MLYNVVVGNTQKLEKNNWRAIESDGFWFYDNTGIRQRIRIDNSLSHEISAKWETDTVQCYAINPEMRWRNNTSNLNGALRPIYHDNPNLDTSEQILVYVTVMNNYRIVDFETKYSILNTYHRKGEYQGCTLVLTRKELETIHSATALRIYAYDVKKKQPRRIDIGFQTIKEENAAPNKKPKINGDHLSVRVKGIKDADEKNRVLNMINQYKDSYLGFKCVVRPNVFLTSTYFVAPGYKDMIENIVRFKNKNIVVVDAETLENPKKLRALVADTCAKRKIRAITEVGLRLPINVLTENRIIYVFTYCDGVDHGLKCIKSN